jgi:hypothetical protein
LPVVGQEAFGPRDETVRVAAQLARGRVIDDERFSVCGDSNLIVVDGMILEVMMA